MNFEQYLQQKGFMPSTIRFSVREVKQYHHYLAAQQTSIESVTQKNLLAYLHYLQQRGLSKATIGSILPTLQHYHRYLAKHCGSNNIAAFIRLQGTKKKPLQYVFTPAQLDGICDAYYHHVRTYQPTIKNQHSYTQTLQGRYIALTLIVYQGLQTAEVQNLTQTNFDLRKGTVKIHPHQKGAGRVLPLEPLQIGSLLQYYHTIEETEKKLITNRGHFDILHQQLKTLNHHYKNLRQLRTSRITYWLGQYGLRKTQYLAGHRQISSTEAYQPNNIQHLQNSLDSFHPLR